MRLRSPPSSWPRTRVRRRRSQSRRGWPGGGRPGRGARTPEAARQRTWLPEVYRRVYPRRCTRRRASPAPRGGVDMSDLQVRWTDDELLAEEPGLEPLVIAGRRCHGGLDTDGVYHSPRSRFRNDAIAAWQAQHRADFGTELFDAGLDTWPPPAPNVAQSRFLLQHGVREPIMAALTRIGTVEGFGGAMRLWNLDDPQSYFADPI